MTTIRLHDGDMGSEEMLVRCDLTRATAPVEVDYQADDEAGWESTLYQCADARHTTSGLVEVATILAAQAFESAPAKFGFLWTLLDADGQDAEDQQESYFYGNEQADAETDF